MDITRIGGRIRAARDAKGWDIAQLAEKAELNYNTVQRLETGGLGEKTSLAAVARIAKVMGLSLDALVKGCL